MKDIGRFIKEGFFSNVGSPVADWVDTLFKTNLWDSDKFYIKDDGRHAKYHRDTPPGGARIRGGAKRLLRNNESNHKHSWYVTNCGDGVIKFNGEGFNCTFKVDLTPVTELLNLKGDHDQFNIRIESYTGGTADIFFMGLGCEYVNRERRTDMVFKTDETSIFRKIPSAHWTEEYFFNQWERLKVSVDFSKRHCKGIDDDGCIIANITDTEMVEYHK